MGHPGRRPSGGADHQLRGHLQGGSTPAIDPTTDSVYVRTGNNYLIPAAADKCVANALKNHTSDANCTAADDYFDSVLSLNLKTGKIYWGRKVEGYDAWTLACLFQPSGVGWCPSPEGDDYDFGSAPNLFTTRSSAGKAETLVGDGQKSGIYWAFNAATGKLAWDTLVGPGSADGGALWGTATDGSRIRARDRGRLGLLGLGLPQVRQRFRQQTAVRLRRQLNGSNHGTPDAAQRTA